MNGLKIFYHLLYATTISAITYFNYINGCVTTNTHLTQLLLNIDF